MIRLNLRALSVYGKKITESLRSHEKELQRHCSCPPGESCSVEITELPGRRFEAMVTRPRAVTEAHDWSPITAVDGMYRRLFEKRTSAKRIHDAIAQMVHARIGDTKAPAVPENDEIRIVVIDPSTLRRAQGLIIGCRTCSRFAEIPFGCILDSLTGTDPSMTRVMLPAGAAKCPRCRREIDEDTLVEFKPPSESRH